MQQCGGGGVSRAMTMGEGGSSGGSRDGKVVWLTVMDTRTATSTMGMKVDE